MLSEPKDSAAEPVLEARAWDRFDSLARPSPNGRNLRQAGVLRGGWVWRIDAAAHRRPAACDQLFQTVVGAAVEIADKVGEEEQK